MKIYASTSHLQSIVDSSISDPDVDIFGIRAPSTTIGFVFRNARIGATFFRFLLRYHVRNRTFVTSRSLDRKRKSKRSTVGRKMKTARMPEPTRSLERPIFPNRRPKAGNSLFFIRATVRSRGSTKQRVSQDGKPT